MPLAFRTVDRSPSVALRRFAWGVLAYFIATILWGAVVRATGSGAGCGDHWPLCNGTVLQQSPNLQTIIEFTHRITAGLDMIFVLGLLVWTWRTTVKGHLARWAAGVSVFFTITEGFLGAMLVKLGLTAQSHSPLRAPFLALHLSNTLLLVAALTLAAHFLGRTHGVRWRDIRIAAPVATTIGMVTVLIVAVTGSLAALGDTLYPATTLSNSLAADLSNQSNWLIRWRWTHPAIAALAAIFVIWLLVRAGRRSIPGGGEANRLLSLAIVALLAAQYLLGVMDIWLLAPTWMQVTHLLGADALWVALVILAARLMLVPAQHTFQVHTGGAPFAARVMATGSKSR
ncbi:MAG TPA: COX15/CtaA family protein [Acidobacteriaceae bacterium]|nr:COX15/CtaA family protein [Acidobacteriaceae bacterium]